MQFKGKKVLLLGSGGLRIGQAGEFDYSGSQAIKALKEEGIQTVLINPNIATVQTDMADQVYLQPLTVETTEEIIAKERPDAILLGFGGQTALNLGIKLKEKGILEKYGVEVLGTSVLSIQKTEDRDIFKTELESIGILSPKSLAAHNVEDAVSAANEVGYPIMMRSGFSLGGLGSGLVRNEKDLRKSAAKAFSTVSQILIEEYLEGWKELEYEIIRDSDGNAVTVCNMENFDPMGIHTGESIVVAPSQTLSNEEYHRLREIAISVANHFEIVGECNIQYALNPANGEYRVIEMNARLSRSSALASKATGYPLAFVATKLALGFQLYEIKNAVTQSTSAFFEPALDYVVVKIPRWDTHKLRAANRRIGSEMKSVGEVMAIGRSFPEALQKAVGMLGIGASCLSDYPQTIEKTEEEIEKATDRRLFALYQFFLSGESVEKAEKLSRINSWFLHHLKAISDLEKQVDETKIREAKQFGFSDIALGKLLGCAEHDVRQKRLEQNITPFVKQIDTLAGEFDAKTNYLYMTYHGCDHDVSPSMEPPVIVLGSGPYAIGSSVEFDWCGVNTSRTLRKLGEQTLIINSNPETVSTDYDESDRLYFEQLSFERVQDIADFETPKGIIVSMGGQIANNLSLKLHDANYPLLGTSPIDIDRAENREIFSSLLHKLGVDQPRWIKVTDFESAKAFAEEVNYPVLIRPSYVLSGAAMNIATTEEEMERYLKSATLVSPDHPVVISEFITEAKELEIDGVAKNGEIVIEAISEHVENAGVHSGDATIVLPPQRLYLETIRRTKKITRKIARALNITGPFNIQFIAKNNDIKVIECNVRASRSFPFVSKVTAHNFIEIATEVIMDRFVPRHFETLELDYVGVKTPQFSYSRLKGANPVAHVEMASTGEVACLGDDLFEAFFSSWLATEQPWPKKKVLVSIGGRHKIKMLEVLRNLEDMGWELYTTSGTHDFLSKKGVASIALYKASERFDPNVTSVIANKEVDLIINIPKSHISRSTKTDGYIIRRLAIDHHIPLITNLQNAILFLQCLARFNGRKIPVKSWKEYTLTKALQNPLFAKIKAKEKLQWIK